MPVSLKMCLPPTKIEAVNEFLMQDVDSKYDYEEAVEMLRELFAEAEETEADAG